MYSHVTVGTNDFPRAEKFYDAIMAVLGHPTMFKAPIVLAYGTPTGPKLFILPPFDGNEARGGNGVHAAFKVDARATVDAFHAAALATCATPTATSFKRSVTARRGRGRSVTSWSLGTFYSRA